MTQEQEEIRRWWVAMLWNPYAATGASGEAQRLALFVYRLVIITWLLICAAWAIRTAKHLSWKLDPAQAGQFGDTFGSINALFSGLALAGVAYAIVLQHEELKLTKKQAKDAKDSLDEEKKEREATAKISQERHLEQSRYQAQQAIATLITSRMNAVSASLHASTTTLSLKKYKNRTYEETINIIEFEKVELDILREELIFRSELLIFPKHQDKAALDLEKSNFMCYAQIIINNLRLFWVNYFRNNRYPYSIAILLTKTHRTETSLSLLAMDCRISIEPQKEKWSITMDDITELLEHAIDTQLTPHENTVIDHMNKLHRKIFDLLDCLGERFSLKLP